MIISLWRAFCRWGLMSGGLLSCSQGYYNYGYQGLNEIRLMPYFTGSDCLTVVF